MVLYDLASGDDVVDVVEVRIEAMPNPAHDALMLSGWTPASTVRIWDIQGREIDALRSDGAGRVRLDVSGWTSGMYVAKGWDAGLNQVQAKFEVRH